MENQDQKPIEKINVPLEELLSPEELAVIKEMRANVQIKDSAAMDEQENPLYEPLVSYESPTNMELAKTLRTRMQEMKRHNAPMHLLPERINYFFSSSMRTQRT